MNTCNCFPADEWRSLQHNEVIQQEDEEMYKFNNQYFPVNCETIGRKAGHTNVFRFRTRRPCNCPAVNETSKSETPRTDDLKGGSGQYLGQHLQNNTNILTHISKGESSEVEKIKKAIKHLYADRGVVSGVQLHEIFSAIDFVTKPTTQATTAMQEKQTTDTPVFCDHTNVEPLTGSYRCKDCEKIFDIVQPQENQESENHEHEKNPQTPFKICNECNGEYLELCNGYCACCHESYLRVKKNPETLAAGLLKTAIEERNVIQQQLTSTQQRLNEITEVAREFVEYFDPQCASTCPCKYREILARLEKLKESK